MDAMFPTSCHIMTILDHKSSGCALESTNELPKATTNGCLGCMHGAARGVLQGFTVSAIQTTH